MSAGSSKNSDEPKLKELRVALPKMKVGETQSQPSTSSQAQEDLNAPTDGQAENIVESEESQSPNKNKNVASESNPKVKSRRSRNKQENKEKEPQKPAKSGDEEAKTRTSSRERKNKTEPEKTPGKKMEKGNTPKDKANEKKASGGQKEKKTSKKPGDESHEIKEPKLLLRDDPTLPPGWRRILKAKHVGTELKPVVCIASPEGRKFYFKARLKQYLEKTKSELIIEDFYFGLYQRSAAEIAESRRISLEARKAAAKKASKKQKRSESAGKEHETKKIRLEGGSTSKKEQPSKKEVPEEKEKKDESSDEGEYEAGSRSLLLQDYNLPEGWTRQVLLKNDADGHNKIQVWILSPDGRKFKRKHLLQKYLQKTKSTLNIDQFYFGIYPRPEDREKKPPVEEPTPEPPKKPGKSRRARKRHQKAEASKNKQKEDKTESIAESLKNTTISSTSSKSDGSGEDPSLEDPNLPAGWRRFVKARPGGESGGRTEAAISSPDGKRQKSKGGLENSTKEKGLDLNIEDFDFSVFGKSSKRYNRSYSAASTPKKTSEKSPTKKRGSASHTPGSGSRANTSYSSELTLSREAQMINYVSALMLSSGLRDLRTERRLRVHEQEKLLSEYLHSLPEDTTGDEESANIPTSWVRKLALCRSDFGNLEDDAAETIASLTKDFVARLAQSAVQQSDDGPKLEYNDIADIVDKCDNLAPLRTLIPKKITYKEYLRLNRPTKFTSFT